MFVLQHLRDEAHRFAITFHRRRRSSLTLRSALAEVPGIGPRRQQLLLRHFGSLKKVREATADELVAVPGMTAKAASAVFTYLRGVGATGPSGSEGRLGDTAGAGTDEGARQEDGDHEQRGRHRPQNERS